MFGVDLDDSTQQAFTASGDKVKGERERERERERESSYSHILVTFIIACVHPIV